MKIKILYLTLFFVSTLTFADKKAPPPPGVMDSPFKACQDVTVVSKDKYNKNKDQWKKFQQDCPECCENLQVAEEAGISKLTKLSDTTRYIEFMHKVGDKVIENLDKGIKYAKCSSMCFSGAKSCPIELSTDGKEVSCEERKKLIRDTMKEKSKEVRRELALANDAPGVVEVNASNVASVKNEKLINTNLRDFEMGMANPVGLTKLTDAEYKEALATVTKERAELEAKYKEIYGNNKKNYGTWMSAELMKKIDARKTKYLSLVYAEVPLLGVIDRPKEFRNTSEPVWTDEQLAKSFEKLEANANKTRDTVIDSLSRSKLEFSKPEAFKNWSLQLFTGDKFDLLYYMGFHDQVEEVLKDHKDFCGVATTLSQRLGSRDMHNAGLELGASLATGYVARFGLRFFKLGKAITGAQANAATGLAMGSAFLGDSFRYYNTTMAEISSGMRPAEARQGAKLNLALNLAFAPLMGAQLETILFSSLGKKTLAKEAPEVAALVNKSDAKSKSEAVDKWFTQRIKTAIKNKVIGQADAEAMKSEASAKLMNDLAEDIQKANPKFFQDSENFDVFLKAAAASIKKLPGDPADLQDKAKKLFLNLNMEAFESWEPKAQENLMKLYTSAIDELREAYSKDPATYAKFTSSPDAYEKVIISALRRAGVTEDKISQLKTCALRK